MWFARPVRSWSAVARTLAAGWLALVLRGCGGEVPVAAPHATILLWYPVKSLTRPNAMIARLKAAGVAATVAELVTTPLEHQRQRLNGSGIVLIRPPAAALTAIAAAAPILGARCATRAATWSLRMTAWAGC